MAAASPPHNQWLAALQGLFRLPQRNDLAHLLGDNASILLAEADETCGGMVRLFGAPPVPLVMSISTPLKHWTAYERGQSVKEGEDIKFTWEAGRFGWAFPLARAYHLTGDERYPAAFWAYAESFLEANPPNAGPQWASAQEVALRLMALAFAGCVFAASTSTTSENAFRLWNAIAAHADRIPATLSYARAQNNNHLFSESLGLYTASCLLSHHPCGQSWRKQGWEGMHRSLQTQIDGDGAYLQNSCNYHRLVLSLALWGVLLSKNQGQSFPPETLDRLRAGTHWLLKLVDPATGRVPNLGPNDGAYLFPLTTCSFHDYRPVLQAAAQTFLGESPFPPGPWDELALWLQNNLKPTQMNDTGAMVDAAASITLPPSQVSHSKTPHVLHLENWDSWAYLRVAHFKDRPGHADQLHVDLWWRGRNIAQDPGTYLYNAPPPWDNALAQTAVHNTLTVNWRDQMTQAGRFLWLDWAQAGLVSHQRAGDGSWECLVAQHNGYRRLGLIHRRAVTAFSDGRWQIKDDLLPLPRKDNAQPSNLRARLHWLLPDWPWEIEEQENALSVLLKLNSLKGWHSLRVLSFSNPSGERIASGSANRLQVQIIRAGERLHGSAAHLPVHGWVSPTYGQKFPALSFIVEFEVHLPTGLVTDWQLPENE
jgi:hypothetical protein